MLPIEFEPVKDAVEPPMIVVAAAPMTDSIPPIPKAAAAGMTLPIVPCANPGDTAPRITVPKAAIPAPARILLIVLPVFSLNATNYVVHN